MQDNNAVSLHTFFDAVKQLDEIENNLQELLGGFKLYNEYKGILDIELYQQSLDVFMLCIAAMEEQINNLRYTINKLKELP
jgi:hypothetical protein